MSFLDMFRREAKKNAVELLQQISKRAEDLTPEEQAKSFVAIRRIDGALKSRDSRVIFGRRGTGKTHVLSYMATAASSRGEFSCSIDLRTLGSNNSIYSDHSLSPSIRATTLIRDLITVLHDILLDIYTDPKTKISDKHMSAMLENLHSCVKSVVVTEIQETRRKISQEDAAKLQSGIELNVSRSAASVKGDVKAEISEKMLPSGKLKSLASRDSL